MITTFIAWLPFLTRSNSWLGLTIENSKFDYIYRHFDGPLYIISAKTLYDPKLIENIGLEQNFSTKYFAAHLPLYPLIIRCIAPFMGFLKSMIFTNLIFSILLALLFYYVVVSFRLSKSPFVLTVVFLMLPRFLVVRSVGAPESLFLLLILASLYFFEKQQFILSMLMGALAAAAKTPGILLFPAYFLVLTERYITTKKFNWRSFFIFGIPLGLVAVFLLYLVQYKDFFAYFHSGDNMHLVFPFSVFNFRKAWIGTAWLEEILFYFFMYALTAIFLWKSKLRSFFYFVFIFFIATTFIQHRDISRYSLPLWPFACVALQEFFTSKKTLIALGFMIIPIYFYIWNFLTYNIMPISNWKPFM